MSSKTPAAVTPRRKRMKKAVVFGAAGVAVVAVCLAVRYYRGATEANAQGRAVTRKTTATRPQTPQILKVVAVVHGKKIEREELARDCIHRFGADVLNSLTNKRLILEYCQWKDIRVTRAELEAEVERVANKFKITKNQLMRDVLERRGISPEQYLDDIILPTLALRKAARNMLKITQTELQSAYETEFGPTVEVRMIMCREMKKAQMLLEKAKANPESFGKLAKDYSEDVHSARNEGFIFPIRKHVGDKAIERTAFAMKRGQISQIIVVGEKVGRQHVILKCEQQVRNRYKQFPLDDDPSGVPRGVRKRLENALRERKEKPVAAQVFDSLRQKAKIKIVLGNRALSQLHPGIAAFIGERSVKMERLAEECIRRHGVEVLEGTISRHVLEWNCRTTGIQVSRQDVNAEIARAANAMNFVDKQGNPDVKSWLANVEKEQGLDFQRYVAEIVWPTAALKKYVLKTAPKSIEVTAEDLKKGFEASFGRRVKCKAIVLNNQRTADEVWRMCRAKGSNPIFFGQMAAKYSVEVGGHHLNGDVPPIQKHGGRPLMEKYAWKLQQGEMSGIIQMGKKFIILLCLGHTKPIDVKFEQVRQDIYDDLYEKKLRIAMAKAFDQMMEMAPIENFLANTRHAPKRQTSKRRTPAAAARRSAPRRN